MLVLTLCVRSWLQRKPNSTCILDLQLLTHCYRLGPLLAANTVVLAFDPDIMRSFDDIALLTGYHLAGVGVSGLLFVPTARVFGKRHLYVLGTVLLIISSAWGGAAKSYKSLLWARIIQGVAVTPFEALVNASIGDLWVSPIVATVFVSYGN